MIPTLSSRTQVTTILYTALLALGVGCGTIAEGVTEVHHRLALTLPEFIP